VAESVGEEEDHGLDPLLQNPLLLHMRNDRQRFHCTIMQLQLLHDQIQNKDYIALKLNKYSKFAFL
jgi:hypothetical protein